MFHPPPEDPFIDSSGFALEAIFEDDDGRRVGSGYIASLSPRAMMIGADLNDFSGFVQFQRRESDPFLWDPMLTFNDVLGQWETMPLELRRPHRIVVGLIGRGLLEPGDDDAEGNDE